MKKIDLHLHLDGSLDVTYCSNKYNRDVTSEMQCGECKDLNDYLSKFTIAYDILRHPEDVENLSYLLAKQLVNEDVIYAEIRFNPLYFESDEQTFDEAFECIKKGFNKVNNLKVNYIFCMMRNYSIEENLRVIEYAEKYRNHGCVAVDLAGDEIHYKTETFIPLFNILNNKNIPFIVHAGEADDHTSIDTAIRYGAKRIGHGVHCIESLDTMNALRDGHIPLEICIKSNVDTKAVSSYEDHPIKKIKDYGILITINTDDRTVSNTTLTNEYNIIKKYYNLSDNDLLECNKNSIQYAFLSDKEKEELLEMLEK